MNDKIHFGMLVGESERMQDVYESVKTTPSDETTVLIEGETGTGKELVARAIHKSNTHGNKRFVAINCTAIPRDLIESELFGHEKGAFTSAHTSRVGKLEFAGEGSILLDEIGEIAGEAQVKLLRVLEEREFNRVGGNGTIRLKSRIIATTNRPLLRMVDEGRFRDDLYHRLSEFTIYIPPLRERKEDLPLLVGYFLDCSRRRIKKEITSISKEALNILIDHDWPGNIRELKNVINRAAIAAKGREITPGDLRIQKRKPKEEAWIILPPDLSLLEVEKRVILRTIEHCYGDKKKAAKALGIATSTLYEKLKRF